MCRLRRNSRTALLLRYAVGRPSLGQASLKLGLRVQMGRAVRTARCFDGDFGQAVRAGLVRRIRRRGRFRLA